MCCAALAAAKNLLLLMSSSRLGVLRDCPRGVLALWESTLHVLYVDAPHLRSGSCLAAAYGLLEVVKEEVLVGLAGAQGEKLLAVAARACMVQPLAGMRVVASLARCPSLYLSCDD